MQGQNKIKFRSASKYKHKDEDKSESETVCKEKWMIKNIERKEKRAQNIFKVRKECQ